MTTTATPAAPAPQETKPADESLGSRVLRVLLTQRIALLAVLIGLWLLMTMASDCLLYTSPSPRD